MMLQDARGLKLARNRDPGAGPRPGAAEGWRADGQPQAARLLAERGEPDRQGPAAVLSAYREIPHSAYRETPHVRLYSLLPATAGVATRTVARGARPRLAHDLATARPSIPDT